MTALTGTPRTQAVLLLVTHHAVVGVHAVAHGALRIALTPFQAGYVGAVIIAAPIIAVLLVLLRRDRIGGFLLLGSMIASLVFGVVSHAVLAGTDNVFEVEPGGWAIIFQVTGLLLAVVESGGAWIAARILRFASQTS